MVAKRHKAIGWLSALGVMAVLGVGASMLLGAAQQGAEVLQIDAAAYISPYVGGTTGPDPMTLEKMHLFLAVTSPTRGAAEQLQRGNIRVRDGRWADPGGIVEHPDDPQALQVVGFANMGGGFYRVELAPEHSYMHDDSIRYVVLIEIQCPWGRGIAVCELPLNP